MRKRYQVLLPAVVLGTLFGLWLGGRTAVVRADGSDASDAYLRTFTQILEIVERQYVDEVPSEDLVTGAIRGMLTTLDPHSNFLDRRSYQEMREEQRGSFSGLGIVISLRGDENLLTVISPIEGTPAERAGIRAGDVIAEIEGNETIGMSIDDALMKLRGRRGTQVSIGIRREGSDDLLPFTITRDDIPTNSIQYAYMIRPGTGYIRIKNFTQTTESELKEKLDELEEQGMEQLVLDLRWNPGGLLDQAVRVSSLFLDANDKIVFTRGRTERSNEEYLVPAGGHRFRLPMVVLINRGSASASEIVAGSIQDHDRGLVVGETSWGKGLVQTVYSLSDDAALALTTARYYTPSGRLIQRDYASLEDYFSPSPEDDATVGSPEVEKGEVHFTRAGRKVYGGGGIHPDVFVSLNDLTDFTESLERRSVFFEFATHYRVGHPDPPDEATFRVDDEVMQAFRAFLDAKEIEATDEELKANDDYVRRGIKAEIFANYFGLVERNKVLSEGDTQLQEALRSFDRARQLVSMRAAADAPVEEAPVPN
ncbi:MAG: S41 family peptidase [Acidobacteriota bacterium]